MKEILFEGIRKENGEKVIGCLINNLFYVGMNTYEHTKGTPVVYIIPNDEFDYDCWEDIAEYMDGYEVIPESVKQLTFIE